MIQKIGIIGSGNVAWHLVHGLNSIPKIEVKWVFGRNKTTLTELSHSSGVPFFMDVLLPQEVDLVIVCVNDDAIQNILDDLPKNLKVAYTSGTFSLSQLVSQQQSCGVFYPLQTFTKNQSLDLNEVPFLIEATEKSFENELLELARKISRNVQVMDSEQRRKVHIAAVISNNFVNHLLFIAQKFLKENNLDEKILNPLIRETISKAERLGPYRAQSGPARRLDVKTIQTHLEALKGKEKEIYQLITKSIEETYKNDDL